jgi:hypothetical protein
MFEDLEIIFYLVNLLDVVVSRLGNRLALDCDDMRPIGEVDIVL